MTSFDKINQHDLISILWLFCHLHFSNRKSLQGYTFQKYKKNPKYQPTSNNRRITHLRGVKTLKKDSNYNIYRRAVHSQRAYMSQHEINARTKFPATNLEKGWIIDSGASAHMAPFQRDCNNIQPTYKIIYLADGSSVLCKYMEIFHYQLIKITR